MITGGGGGGGGGLLLRLAIALAADRELFSDSFLPVVGNEQVVLR